MNSRMYPLKLNHLYYEKLWGGRALEKFRLDLPLGNIGESWDIACHNHGTSTIINGWLQGETLDEVIKKYPDEILGEDFRHGEFPLLIKIITAKEKLSVQVHPNDEYAYIHENSQGKMEAWYVLEAEENSTIVLGTKNCNKEEFKLALKENKLDKYLNKIKIHKGDMYFIPSGMIHAIGKGCTLVEIQQNCDITYRVYDYGRPRELHIDKAIEVIDFSLDGNKSIIRSQEKVNATNNTLLQCEGFNVDELCIENRVVEKGDKFHILTTIEGSGALLHHGEIIELNYGESILIPKAIKEYIIEGKCKLLKSYIN